MKTPNIHPFRLARRAAVPIMAINTADPAATIRGCAAARNGKPDAFLAWDCVRGLIGLDKLGKEVAATIGEPADTQNLVQMLATVGNPDGGPRGCTIFLLNAQAALKDYTALQAIWNCRDVLKSAGSSLVLLGPSLVMPPELSNDVPVFDEPVPTAEEIETTLDDAVNDAKKSVPEFPEPTKEERARIIDTLTGYLCIFPIEQALALATTKDGIDLRKLWELKVASLRNTAGLEISQPVTTFADMAGCGGIKDFGDKLINGRQRFRGVFFLDEIEKMLAGGAGDLSGTSQAMIEQFLYWTEAKKVMALLLLGVPGAGKSWTAQCIAGQANVPLLRGSMSTVKGSLVGQSEANMKQLLKTIDSVTQENTLMIATCNSLDALTPEILARFKLGVFFYDYPTAEEQAALWALYMKKYELAGDTVPQVSRWVGREVESCCHRAWLFNVPLAEAARSVVPVSRANGKRMDVLRQSAAGRFLSASKPGIYEVKENETAATGRSLSL